MRQMAARKNAKGFMMTLITLALFMLLIGLVLSMQTSRSAVDNERTKLAATKKVLYTFDDIEEDVANISGVQIVRNGTNLTIFDRLPTVYNVTDTLGAYESFIRSEYDSPEMEVSFMDEGGNLINLSELQPEIIIMPTNLSYSYPNYGKRELKVECNSPPCNNTEILQLNLVYNWTNASFDYAPESGNESKYNWAPDALGPPCSGSTCINFTLVITDNMSQTYSCPGPICNYTQFDTTGKSKLDIHGNPCWLAVQLGDSSGDIFVQLRAHQPGNDDACDGTILATQTSFNFSVYNYVLNFPARLKVRDTNYNISKEDSIRGFG